MEIHKLAQDTTFLKKTPSEKKYKSYKEFQTEVNPFHPSKAGPPSFSLPLASTQTNALNPSTHVRTHTAKRRKKVRGKTGTTFHWDQFFMLNNCVKNGGRHI